MKQNNNNIDNHNRCDAAIARKDLFNSKWRNNTKTSLYRYHNGDPTRHDVCAVDNKSKYKISQRQGINRAGWIQKVNSKTNTTSELKSRDKKVSE